MIHCKQFGLSKQERIVNDKEFEHVYKTGTIRKSGCLIVRSLANNLKYSRLGVAVSKKIFRNAVTRNRIKRLIREAFRLNKYQLPKGIDFIVGVRFKDAKSFTLPGIKSGLTDTFIAISK